MPALETLSDRLWKGETSTADPAHHPFAILNQIEEVAEGVAFYKSFSNITVVKTGEGSVLIDTGSFHPVAHARSFKGIRTWTEERIHTAIYTHGHVDHAYGLPPFLQEAEDKGWEGPVILGHAAIRRRMDRYIETAGYNGVINERQFNQPIAWPTDPIYPTKTYDTETIIHVGGTPFELRHAKGETDDHTWIFLPEQRVLCTGDFFIWAAPNAGNPQKVQRYIREWARALRAMAARKPLVLLPGHGLPVYGAGRVQDALNDTAEYLESLYDQTLALMNQGATVDELIHSVKTPSHLEAKPYLQPVYDEPEFVVRNIHRCLGGWYSGVPSELKPAPLAAQGQEIAQLAGGVEKILARAQTLLAQGNTRLACHLADWAVQAEPNNKDVHKLRAKTYNTRAEQELSTMAKGIYRDAAKTSARHLQEED